MCRCEGSEGTTVTSNFSFPSQCIPLSWSRLGVYCLLFLTSSRSHSASLSIEHIPDYFTLYISVCISSLHAGGLCSSDEEADITSINAYSSLPGEKEAFKEKKEKKVVCVPTQRGSRLTSILK